MLIDEDDYFEHTDGEDSYEEDLGMNSKVHSNGSILMISHENPPIMLNTESGRIKTVIH